MDNDKNAASQRAEVPQTCPKCESTKRSVLRRPCDTEDGSAHPWHAGQSVEVPAPAATVESLQPLLNNIADKVQKLSTTEPEFEKWNAATEAIAKLLRAGWPFPDPKLIASEAASQPAPAPIGFVSEISSESPSCTLCGAAMQFKCLSCGSTPAPVSQPAPAAQYRDFTETDADLFAIAEMLPETFYADRPLHFRIGRMVESWKEAVRANVMLEDKLAPEGQPAPAATPHLISNFARGICDTIVHTSFLVSSEEKLFEFIQERLLAFAKEVMPNDSTDQKAARSSTIDLAGDASAQTRIAAASPAPPARTDSNVSFAETFLATAWHDDFEDQSADLVAKILQFAGDYEKWMDATKDVRPAAPPARDQRQDEYSDSISLANRVLDIPNVDPDGDICLLARQFLRALEREHALVEALKAEKKISDSCRRNASINGERAQAYRIPVGICRWCLKKEHPSGTMCPEHPDLIVPPTEVIESEESESELAALRQVPAPLDQEEKP